MTTIERLDASNFGKIEDVVHRMVSSFNPSSGTMQGYSPMKILFKDGF